MVSGPEDEFGVKGLRQGLAVGRLGVSKGQAGAGDFPPQGTLDQSLQGERGQFDERPPLIAHVDGIEKAENVLLALDRAGRPEEGGADTHEPQQHVDRCAQVRRRDHREAERTMGRNGQSLSDLQVPTRAEQSFRVAEHRQRLVEAHGLVAVQQFLRAQPGAGKQGRRGHLGPIRCLENNMARQFLALENDRVPSGLLSEFGTGRMQSGLIEGDVDGGSLMAGQISGLIHEIKETVLTV